MELASDHTTHTEQSIPYEWRAVELGEETLVIHDVPESLPECYRIAGRTLEASMLEVVDAVLYEGTLVEPVFDDQTRKIRLSHAYAGRRASFDPEMEFDSPVVLLERCDHVELDQQLTTPDGDQHA